MTLLLKTNSRWVQARRYWDLLYVLIARNLKVRYRGSFLGIYWSLLNPLMMTGVYTAIFGTVFASYYEDSTLNYALAAFTGLVVINFFSASTSQALISVVANGPLLNKIALPMNIFPVSIVLANAFNLAVGIFPLLAAIALVNSRNLFNVIALSLPLLALVGVCLGVGFLVSTLYVFFRDLPYLYELVIFLLLISSPVFYPAAIVPPSIQPFLALNLLSPIIESIRQIALSGTLPELSLISRALLGSLIILVIGYSSFQSWQDKFIDVL